MTMIASPHLSRLYLYPIKSLDGVALEQATVLDSGALQHDREFALLNEQQHYVNGKRTDRVHRLRSLTDLAQRQVHLQVQGTGEWSRFHLDRDRPQMEQWFSEYFGFPIHLAQNPTTGFPDDLNASGPTVISTATIAAIASWFPDLSPEEVRQRVRANLEIDGVPPFWEDQLFAEAGQCVQFQIGDVVLDGINPCQRCVVLTRDSQTGIPTDQFQKVFVQKRRALLPDWTVPKRFNHFYRLSVNTNISASQTGKVLRVGDRVQILGITASSLS